MHFPLSLDVSICTVQQSYHEYYLNKVKSLKTSVFGLVFCVLAKDSLLNWQSYFSEGTLGFFKWLRCSG